MIRIPHLAPLLALGGALVPAASSQTELYSVTSNQPQEGFGTGIAALDDIDGDGTLDFAVGTPFKPYVLAGGITALGDVTAYSGASGVPLWTATQDPGDPRGHLGYRLALVGDLNGDGVRDLAATRPGGFFEPGTSRLIFLSGRDGTRLGATAPVNGASSITAPLGVADADGDGLRDVLAVEVPGGQLRVLALYSSATGAKLQEWIPASPGEAYSSVLAEIGDVDGLGRPDYAIPVRSVNSSGIVQVHIGIISAETGVPLPSLVGIGFTIRSIWGMKLFSDMDGDGLPELAVLSEDQIGNSTYSALRIVSTINGAVLLAGVVADNPTQGSLAIIGDYDRDGVDDLVVGLPDARELMPPLDPSEGAVGIFSGRTLLEIGRFKSPYPKLALGQAVAAIGDLNGDGLVDFLSSGRGVFDLSGSTPSRLVAIAAPEYVTYAYCDVAAANSTGMTSRLEASGTTSIALNDLVVGARDLPQHVFGYLLVSDFPDGLPGMGGSLGLCIKSPIGRLSGPGQIQFSGAAGVLDVAIDLTHVPTPTGFVAARPFSTLYFQCWHRDVNPLTSSVSNGLGVALIP